jgi:hypothetical protein
MLRCTAGDDDYPTDYGSRAVERGFVSPPDSARPMVRWWWFGVAVEKPEILRELQQMKTDGIGGAELAFVYPQVLDDPSTGLQNLPFVSPAMLDAVTYAETEGRRLGLRIDVTIGSGWPYGGPATTRAQAAERMRVLALPLPATATCLPLPKLEDGDSIIGRFIANGDAGHWDVESAKAVSTAVPAESGAARVALFFIAGHTGQQVKRAAVGAEGYVLDPFSREAVAMHLKAVGEPLVKAFGNTPPYAIFSDSLEAYGADWTAALPEEFRRRRGYDLMARLPELVADESPAADTLRHDYGRTLTELVNENYLVQINDWAHAHHTKFRSQTYGEPAVTLSSQRLVDLPEGEGPQWRKFSTLRWATSGNHLFGNTVSSGETFTWLHSPVFRATPLDMKAEADIDFIMGENQLIYHGWPYSALQVGEPGWSLYAAAVFNDHNPWHPVMPAVNSYVARVSFLLRQGKPANQVALLLPTDDAWASFVPGKVTISVSGAMTKLVPERMMSSLLTAGYNVDFTDADAINRLGVDHSILVLPPTDRIPLVALRRIDEFVKAGGKVLAAGRAPSMDADGTRSPEFVQLLGAVFGAGNLVGDVGEVGVALNRMVAPDLKMEAGTSEEAREAIGFIRRRLVGGDVYFVANTSNQTVKARAAFASAFATGARWDPETGAMTVEGVRAAETMLELAPYESAVYVFQKRAVTERTSAATDATLIDLSMDWKVTFMGIHQSTMESRLVDWMDNPKTLHYSGEAVYSRDFTMDKAPSAPVYLKVDGGAALPIPPPATAFDPVLRAPGSALPNPLKTGTGPGIHAYFDPPVHEAALVTINGQAAGALWHPPYRLDVSKLLRPGINRIEVRVYNTALNAWSAQPPHDYKPLIARYGDRFQMQDLDRVKPIASGLLGSVRLTTGEGRK